MLNIVHNNVYFVHIAAHHYFLQKQDMMRISFYLKLRKQYICHHIKLCKLVPHLTKVMKQKMYTANIQQCLQFLQYVYQQTQAASYMAVPSLVAQFLLKDAASHIWTRLLSKFNHYYSSIFSEVSPTNYYYPFKCHLITTCILHCAILILVSRCILWSCYLSRHRNFFLF